MKIVHNYERKQEEKRVATGTQRCPKCQKDIPLAEWSEHLRMELLDRKWLTQKMELIEKSKNPATAAGEDISQNLRRFVGDGARGDAFGEEEAAARMDAARRGEAEAPRVVWDGHAGSITRTTANVAMMAHQQLKNVEEAMKQRTDFDPRALERVSQQMPQQIKEVHQQLTKGAPTPSPVSARPLVTQTISASATVNADIVSRQMGLSTLVGMNKIKTEDEANLVPEAEWLEMYPDKLNV